MLSKVFTAVIRNRLYNSVYSNKYIESGIQKGFLEDVSGYIENGEIVSHIINTARLKQRSLECTNYKIMEL